MLSTLNVNRHYFIYFLLCNSKVPIVGLLLNRAFLNGEASYSNYYSSLFQVYSLLKRYSCSFTIKMVISFFFKFISLIYLFLAALGLCCCPWAFSSCGERGLHFVAVCRLLIAVASLVAEQGL